MGDMIAKGKLADVREDRQELAQRFAALEIDSLKVSPHPKRPMRLKRRSLPRRTTTPPHC